MMDIVNSCSTGVHAGHAQFQAYVDDSIVTTSIVKVYL